MWKLVQIAIGVGVSALMLYLAFRGVDLNQLKEAMLALDLWPLIPCIALWLVHYMLRALRWHYLLPSVERNGGTFRQLFDAIILGNLATFMLPLRLGEFIRPLVLSQWTVYPFATSFASVVIERFFDLSAVLISLALLLPFLPDLPSWAHYGALSLGGLAVALLVFIVVGCLWPNFVQRCVDLFVRPFPAALSNFAKKFTADLLKGAAVVGTPKRLIMVVTLTVVVWLTSYLQFYVLFWMFPHPYSFLLATTVGVFVALAVALPSAPGFVGVFQAGCVAGSALFGYPTSAAQVYSLVMHALVFILFIVVGFWLLAVHDLSLGELKTAVRKNPQPV